jgi:hypothetical protein
VDPCFIPAMQTSDEWISRGDLVSDARFKSTCRV